MTKNISSFLFCNKSIIYINYSPYENSGKIFDYLLENFNFVFLFSLGFHNLNKKGIQNQLLIYHQGNFKKRYSLFQLPVPQVLLFASLPIRSLITMTQVIYYTYLLKSKYGKLDIFLSVNAFTSWIGVLLQKMNLVSKTIFWVWDYYPPIHESIIITLARKLYWYFDKWAAKASDKTVFVNRRLLQLREKMAIVFKRPRCPIIPLGTEVFKINLKEKKEVIFGFIGVVKKSMGLSTIFNNADQIVKHFPKAKLHIIGSGPDLLYLKKQAKEKPLPTIFHGYLEEKDFNDVLKTCSIGIALYQQDPNNVSSFGDAGKAKRYLSLGIPVIITDTVEFSKEIEKNRAGIVVKYESSGELIKAIKKIMSNYITYQKNALNLSIKFHYKKVYPAMFQFT